MDFLKQMDLTHSPFTFFTDKSSTYRTSIGVIVTLLLGIVGILAIVGFGIEIISKDKPRVNFSNQVNTETLIEKRNLQIYVGLSSNSGSQILEIDRKFNITIRSIENKSGSAKRNEYIMNRCDFKTFSEDLYINLKKEMVGPESDYFCVPDNFNHTINKLFGSNEFNTTIIGVSPCVNSTLNKNNCYPRSIIDTQGTTYLHLIVKDTLIDSTSYEFPLRTVWYNDIVQLQTNTERVQLVSFQKINYSSDDGIIMTAKKIYNSLMVKKEYDEFFYTPGTSRFLNIRLTNNRYYIKIDREYKKIQEIAANVGGIVKFFSFFLFTFSEAFSEFKFTKLLL